MSTQVVNIHWNKHYDMYCGRGRDPRTMIESPWGNPFSHLPGRTLAQYIVTTREEAVARHRQWIPDQPELLTRLPELYNKTLACFCLPSACHVTTLAELADKYMTLQPKDWLEFLESLRHPSVATKKSSLWDL